MFTQSISHGLKSSIVLLPKFLVVLLLQLLSIASFGYLAYQGFGIHFGLSILAGIIAILINAYLKLSYFKIGIGTFSFGESLTISTKQFFQSFLEGIKIASPFLIGLALIAANYITTFGFSLEFNLVVIIQSFFFILISAGIFFVAGLLSTFLMTRNLLQIFYVLDGKPNLETTELKSHKLNVLGIFILFYLFPGIITGLANSILGTDLLPVVILVGFLTLLLSIGFLFGSLGHIYETIKKSTPIMQDSVPAVENSNMTKEALVSSPELNTDMVPTQTQTQPIIEEKPVTEAPALKIEMPELETTVETKIETNTIPQTPPIEKPLTPSPNIVAATADVLADIKFDPITPQPTEIQQPAVTRINIEPVTPNANPSQNEVQRINLNELNPEASSINPTTPTVIQQPAVTRINLDPEPIKITPPPAPTPEPSTEPIPVQTPTPSSTENSGQNDQTPNIQL